MTLDFDTVVVGGGPAGVAAALASARGGCRTLLVERYGFMGGMATAGLVNPFAGNCYVDPETGKGTDILDGIFGAVLARLRERQAVKRCRFSLRGAGFYDAFDERQLRFVYDSLLEAAGVEMLFHAWLLDAQTNDGRIHEVRVQTKGGIVALRARQFIDSTGDADLAAASGVAFDVGRAEDGLCQPCSMMFRMAGVDKEDLLKDGLDEARRKVSACFDAARAAGKLEYPYKTWVQFYDYPRPGALHFNMTRVWQKSGIEARQLSDAEREGRRQTRIFTDWITRDVPWFRHAWLEMLGTQIGVRETRRIRGRYRMTADDIRSGARFEDGIARSGYFIDIHDPKTATDPHIVTGARGTVRAEFKPQRYYEIPFRSLQPESVENLLVACRALSTTFEAHAAVRVMATMHAVGEAAGRAAALALRNGIQIGDVNGAEVRREITYLGQYPSPVLQV